MVLQDIEVFSAMQTSKPYRTYRKTVLGQVYITVLNSFSGAPEGKLLKGNKNEESSLVDVWSEKEDVFFKRLNVKNMKAGYVVEYTRPETAPISGEEKMNTLSDLELNKILNNKYMALTNALNQMTSPAPVYRLLAMAEEQEKSEKIVECLRKRLSELQE